MWSLPGRLVLGCLILVASAHGAPESHSAKPPRLPTLTVATFNILFQNFDLAAVHELIEQSEADIVFLQETNSESLDYLQRRLRARYPHQSWTDDEDWAAGGFALLSKLPIISSRYVPRRHGGIFGTQVAELSLSPAKWGHARLTAVNVHLAPVNYHRLARAGSMAAISKEFARLQAIHAKEMPAILAEVAGKELAVVGGDFNSVEGQVAWRELAGAGFAEGPRTMARPTWHWRAGGIFPISLRIDAVFANAALRPVSSVTTPTAASDHSLVVTTLELVRN
ncbi:MAG: endonuclease/exonuclease/phosphatase family protein [Myxococcales bacterium]|nr:endonuclease/exonuclease/phosphatase family protein [Myxococcales bacterium]